MLSQLPYSIASELQLKLMKRVEAKIQANFLSLELITPPQILLTITADDQLKTPLFQKIVQYDSLEKQYQFVFSNIEELFFALQKVISANKSGAIVVDSNGKVHFQLEITVYGKVINKTMTFVLEERLQPNQQVAILRATLQIARKEIDELKQQVRIVAQDNNKLKAKYQYLQQLFVCQPPKKENQTKNEQKSLSKQFETKANLTPKQEEQTQIQDISSLQPIAMKIEFDQQCMYYSKFKIEDNKVSSLFEDYYQIYMKNALPKKGILRLKMKMIGENHLSIGLLAKSALNNQYSFQNSKAICFYSYYYGNFRGIYYRGKYEALEWNIQKGEILEMELDMNNKIFKIKMQKGTTAQLINFSQLYQEEPLYFFLQMYEKNNAIQFIK